jgi:hypothetical protein
LGAVLASALCAALLGACAPAFTADGPRGSATRVSAAATRVSTTNNPAPRVRTTNPVPLPNPALLERQPAPDCAFRGPLSTPPTAEETRQKLDYEQQCYRQAESIVRARLQQLQDSVQATIRAVRQR